MKNKKEVGRTIYQSGILIIFLTFTISMSNAIAKNYVKVATIGALPKRSEDNISQKTVDHVIGFWDNQLQQVIYDKPDLIVLPEHAGLPRGISMGERKKYLQVRKDQVINYFKSVAKTQHCYIAFGMLRIDAVGNLWNSLILLNRNGETIGIYNKNYPTIGEMKWGIKPGTQAPIFKCDFGTVGMAICFDLNFDELRERYAVLKPDIILFSSAYHGGIVQSEWSYSCRAFFVGSISGRGCLSQIRNPLGEVVASSTNYFDFAVTTINLDSRVVHLDYNWEKLRALKKKYGTAVTIHDPGHLGAVLVSSDDKNVSVDQMIKEFHIELLDHYFNRSRNFRLTHEIKKSSISNRSYSY